MILQPHVIAVTEASQVSEARRVALKLASDKEWSETAAGKLAIVVTEAATNLVKHAHLGEIHLGLFHQDGSTGIEMLALDRGPGVACVEDCLRDRYSTQGTSGTGLGAMTRIAHEFDIYSQEGKGTCVMARLYPSADLHSRTEKRSLTMGAVQVPVRGERECGDSWGFRQESDRTVLMLADGLGHGPDAAEASRQAIKVLERATELAPVALLEQVHLALRSTRGAAVAVAHLETASQEIRFAGLGNISAMIVTLAATQHLVSYNGTAGHTFRRLREFSYSWPSNALLVMHSDGITTSWRLDAYPGLRPRHPSLLAAVLFRDASRGRDDACVVVVRAAA